MLPKENRLKKNSQFTYIYKHGLSKHSKFLSVSYVKTKYQPFKIGFTVSKKIGKSVIRSKVKRYLREATRLELKNINNGYNYVFIAREGIDQLNLEAIRKIIIELITKAGLYKAKNQNESKPNG
jgi:ribonuclease P protein component